MKTSSPARSGAAENDAVPARNGVGAMRLEKRLDLIVDLRKYEDLHELERVSTGQQFDTIIGIKVPRIEIPVAPGRDIPWLIEVAALDQKLKSFGHDSAVEFNKNLLKLMAEKRIK